MSSIEEKLNAIAQIQVQLLAMQDLIQKDQERIQSELSNLKSHWNDSQMERFASNAYVQKFNETLSSLSARLKKAVNFLESKHSTLTSHRN